jgi:hypothetical protein
VWSSVFWGISPFSPLKWTYGSAKYFASIFTAQQYDELKTSMEQAPCSAHFDTSSRFLTWFFLRHWKWRRRSEMSVDFQRATRFYIPGDRALHNHSSEGLKSCFVKCILYSVWTPLPIAGIYGDSPRTPYFNLIALSSGGIPEWILQFVAPELREFVNFP